MIVLINIGFWSSLFFLLDRISYNFLRKLTSKPEFSHHISPRTMKWIRLIPISLLICTLLVSFGIVLTFVENFKNQNNEIN